MYKHLQLQTSCDAVQGSQKPRSISRQAVQQCGSSRRLANDYPSLRRCDLVTAALHFPPNRNSQRWSLTVNKLQCTILQCTSTVTKTRSFAIAKRTAHQSCLVDLVHCKHCFLRHGLDIPDFSNWWLSRAHRSSIGHISTFWQGTSHRCLSIMPSFSVTSANIAISDISLKTRFFGLHFRRRKSCCIFNYFYVISPDRYRIRWNKAK